MSREQLFGVKPDIISTLNGSGSNPPKCESNIASSSKVPNSKMVKSKKLQEFPNSTYSEFKISDGQKKEVASTSAIKGHSNDSHQAGSSERMKTLKSSSPDGINQPEVQNDRLKYSKSQEQSSTLPITL